jgi:hypothetical protein
MLTELALGQGELEELLASVIQRVEPFAIGVSVANDLAGDFVQYVWRGQFARWIGCAQWTIRM